MDKYKGADVGIIIECEGWPRHQCPSYGKAIVYDKDGKEITKFEDKTKNEDGSKYDGTDSALLELPQGSYTAASMRIFTPTFSRATCPAPCATRRTSPIASARKPTRRRSKPAIKSNAVFGVGFRADEKAPGGKQRRHR